MPRRTSPPPPPPLHTPTIQDELRQDVFLIGLPGSERRHIALQVGEPGATAALRSHRLSRFPRRTASLNPRFPWLQYCELTQREVEYAALSRDTTEADLKQRRELRGGTASYADQAAVRAALHGRVLILEGARAAMNQMCNATLSASF